MKRVFIFIAYEDDVPFYSRLFDDHEKMKMFSAIHSTENKGAVKNYRSDYLDLTDKRFLKEMIAEILWDYSRFLQKKGHLDSDWYSEEPFTVIDYLKKNNLSI